MTDTFNEQRLYFNSIKTNKINIKDVIENWPFIFESKYLQIHFANLMNGDKLEFFSKNFPKVKSAAVKYLKNDDDFEQYICDNSESDEGFLSVIGKMFKEDPKLIFQTFEVILFHIYIKCPIIFVIYI
jgi:hypothetical protein